MRIRDRRRIVAFRNILIHGYEAIDNGVVWDVVRNELPTLIEDLDTLIRQS